MTADDEAGAAPQRRASKSLAHTGSSEAKGGKELWKMAKQKVMREHLVAFTRVRAAHGRAPPSDEDRTPEFRALEVRVDGEAGTVFDTVRVSSKAPASLELDKDGTIHCMLEDTSEDPKLRDARLRQAAVAKLSLDTDPVEANKVGLFKVTSDQLERVDIVGRCGLSARARARRRVPASQSSGRCSSDPPLRPALPFAQHHHLLPTPGRARSGRRHGRDRGVPGVAPADPFPPHGLGGNEAL